MSDTFTCKLSESSQGLEITLEI